MNKQRKNKNKGRRNKNRSAGRGGENTAVTTVVLPRSLGWAARRLRVTLKYSTNVGVTNAGFQYANVRFTPSFAYDVDPTIGSTSMPGFTEYAAIYSLYRTRSSMIKVYYSNADAFPTICYVCPLNADPGANNVSPVFMESSTLVKKVILGPLTGSGVGELTYRMATSTLTGIRDPQVTDDYCGSTSGGSPTNNWYWAVGIFGFSNFVSGVRCVIDVEIELEFFELKSPAA